MPTGAHADALTALLTLAKQLTRASMTAALIQRAPGEVVPLRSEPQLGLRHAPVWHWHLPVTAKEVSAGLEPLPLEHLPSLITSGLPFIPATVAYLDCTAWGQQVTGGLLFVWDAEQTVLAHAPTDDPVLLLRPVYARLLDGRHLAVQTVESSAQFHDIFNSVPQGIVVVSGQGVEAQANLCAAALLRIPQGLVAVDVLAQAMRSARARCDNAAQLDVAYRPLQHALDTEVVVDWYLDDRTWRVNTRPLLGSGLNGRVWLFEDVTAQIQLERVLRRDATHDALTGLFNRRAFFDRAHAHYQSHNATPGRSLALLMFDIDHFKQVNDRYGHPGGDEVLREVAQRAQAFLRDGDVLARYGGEEFILLLDAGTLEEAEAAGERLRQAMAAQPVCVGVQTINVSISVGVTLRGDECEPLAQTLERADQLLYRAKREGRNRVVAGTARS